MELRGFAEPLAWPFSFAGFLGVSCFVASAACLRVRTLGEPFMVDSGFGRAATQCEDVSTPYQSQSVFSDIWVDLMLSADQLGGCRSSRRRKCKAMDR